MSSVFLSVVIPAYNEERNLPATVQRLTNALPSFLPSHELVIVDDGSLDRTGALADDLAACDPRVRAYHHSANRGMGAAFVTGVGNSRGEWTILIPADLALDPLDLPKYFAAAPEADIVVGLRSDRSDYTLVRRFISWGNIQLLRILFRMPLHQFQYISLYRTHVLREIGIEFIHSAFFLPEILIKARARGYRLAEVEVQYIPRRAGTATGASFVSVRNTVRDMLRFWRRGGWAPR